MVPKGRADKLIVDGINTALEALDELGDVQSGLDEAAIVALVENEESALYAALVALIAAETA